MTTYFTIEEIKKANLKLGHYWFSPGTMRGFKSRVSGPVINNMFVSSEKFTDGKRRYTIRKANDDGSISTIGAFGDFNSKETALTEIRRLTKE